MSLDDELKNTIEEIGTATKALHDKVQAGETKSAEDRATLAKLNDRLDSLEDFKAAKEEQATKLAEIEAKQGELLTAMNRVGSDAGVGSAEKAAEYHQKLNGYIRGGEAFDAKDFGSAHPLVIGDGALKGFTLDTKLLSTDSDPDGGFVVSPDQSGRTVMIEFPSSPMRALASVQSTNKPFLEGIYDGDEPTSQETGEREGGSTDETPELGIWRVPVQDYRCNLPVTQNMLDDADLDIASWLMTKGREKMYRDQNTDFITGAGTVRGILSYADGTTRGTVEQIETLTSLKLDWKDLAGIVEEIKSEYITSDAVYLVHRRTRGVMRVLSDDQNRPLWEPSLQAGTPPMYNGYPVISAEDMPEPTSVAGNTFTAGTLPVAFGNFRRGYQIAERQAFDVLADPFTSHPKTIYKMVSRVGGKVVNFETFKLLRIKA